MQASSTAIKLAASLIIIEKILRCPVMKIDKR